MLKGVLFKIVCALKFRKIPAKEKKTSKQMIADDYDPSAQSKKTLALYFKKRITLHTVRLMYFVVNSYKYIWIVLQQKRQRNR